MSERAFVPHNRFAHGPRSDRVHGMGGSSRAMVSANYGEPAIAAPAFATFQQNDRAITFHNIANPNLLRVEAPALERDGNSLKMKLFKNKGRNSEYRLHYFPVGDAHRMTASYGGHVLRDFPIMLKPKSPTAQFFGVRNGRGLIKVSGAYKPHKLSVNTKTPMSATVNDKTGDVTVNFVPSGGHENFNIEYDGKSVNGGNFTVAPHPERVRQQQALAYRQIPRGYMFNTQGGYAMQPGYEHLMQPMPTYQAAMPVATPALLNAAPAPMMSRRHPGPHRPRHLMARPTLMNPSVAAAGYQPMRAAVSQQQQQSVEQARLQTEGPPTKPGYSQVLLGQRRAQMVPAAYA